MRLKKLLETGRRIASAVTSSELRLQNAVPALLRRADRVLQTIRSNAALENALQRLVPTLGSFFPTPREQTFGVLVPVHVTDKCVLGRR